ncbi:hypothetical protein RvY_04435-2 [Ramazzottius varieornatus]|nr:hypothetical protein RvY_04435-2 [Ramazzottius varieornatus]
MVVFQEDSFLKVTDVGKDCGDFTKIDLSDDLCAIVTYVDLSFNSLTSLHGLERFASLQILILDNNDLGDDIELPRLSNLHELSLNNNNISNLDSLLNKITSCTPVIVYLSLLGNPACPTEMENSSYTERDYQEYR